MHIAFLTNYYPPYHLGGFEELCEDVAQGLIQRGHEVFILTSKKGEAEESKSYIYRKLEEVMDIRSYRSSLSTFWGRKRHRSNNLYHLEDFLKKTRPDVFMVWGMWNLHRHLPAYVEQKTFIPLVYYMADYWPTLPDANIQHWQGSGRYWYSIIPYLILGRFALKLLSQDSSPSLRFRHVLCVSEFVRDSLIKSCFEVKNTQIIHNGIDIKEFPFYEKNTFSSRSYRPVDILYAGRFSQEKGVHTTIQAAAKLKSEGYRFRLHLLGSGLPKYVSEIDQLIKSLHLEEDVIFLSRVTREEMPKKLEQFDLLVVPSIWAEPLPRIIQEGMACGLPVIASRTGGIPEILQHEENGLLFTPGDAHDLAQQIKKVIACPELAIRMIYNGRNTVETEFNIEKTVDKIEAYLLKLVEQAA